MAAETTHAEPSPRYQRRSIDELLREKHAKPIEDVRELAVDGVFESDAEVEEFISFYRAQRQLGVEE
jgi:hypothetical protein